MIEKNTPLHDAARLLRKAARLLDVLADDVAANVVPDASLPRRTSIIIASIDAATVRIRAIELKG